MNCKNATKEDLITKFDSRIETLSNKVSDLMCEVTKLETEQIYYKDLKVSTVGECEQKYENSFKKLNVQRGIHFGKVVINGNNFHKIYENFNNGEAILLECFDDKPELKTSPNLAGVVKVP